MTTRALAPATQRTKLERRRELRARPGHRFVDSSEFQALLVSTGVLERSDVRACGVLGLQDRHTGLRYLIEEENL
jgi:hypothetical protein